MGISGETHENTSQTTSFEILCTVETVLSILNRRYRPHFWASLTVSVNYVTKSQPVEYGQKQQARQTPSYLTACYFMWDPQCHISFLPISRSSEKSRVGGSRFWTLKVQGRPLLTCSDVDSCCLRCVWGTAFPSEVSLPRQKDKGACVCAYSQSKREWYIPTPTTATFCLRQTGRASSSPKLFLPQWRISQTRCLGDELGRKRSS